MLARILTSLALIVTLLFQNAFVLPARHAADVQLKAVLVADIHADADPTRDRSNVLRQIFAAMGKTQNDADTLVMAGDLTNSGDRMEYVNLFNALNLYGRFRDRVPELGNHDSWNHSDAPDFAEAERLFKAFCRRNGVKTDKVYYKKVVNDIPFLVLGVEDSDFKNPYHSDEQLDWFEAELNAAVAQGRPVFVICHKPLDYLGNAAARMEQILTNAAEAAAAPIVYVCGHTHDIGSRTFRQPNNKLVFLELPSLQYTCGGGLGFVAEVTAHEVTLTGMNFFTGQPLDDFEYHIVY